MKNSIRTPALAATALGAGALLALAAPLAASAHVTVGPNTAEAGSYALVQVKVPNESETAATDRLELDLPTDTPFGSVSYVPVPGWTTELVTTTLPEPVTIGESELTEAVTKVIWTAQPGSELADGQLQQFGLSVGPVPDTGSIEMPAHQHYTDGTVVDWDGSGDEPAPVLYVKDAPPSDDHHADSGSDDAAGEHGDGEHAATADAVTQPDVLARVLGILGLVVGAVGVVVGVTARRGGTPRSGGTA